MLFCSSGRRDTRGALVTGVQTCARPISAQFAPPGKERRAPARSVRTAPAETASWPLIAVGREQVALAPDGADELWLARIGFNFSAQASHVHIDGTIEWGAIVTLQQIDQAIAAEHLVGVLVE